MDVLKTITRKLRKEKVTLEKRLAQITGLLTAMDGATHRRRRKVSASARRKMAAAQRRRWREAKKSSAKN